MESSPLLALHSGARFSPQKSPRVSPGSRSNWLSRITFTWLGPLLQLGASHPLEAPDLWPLEAEDETFQVTNILRATINSNQSLWVSIRHAFGYNMYIAGACKLVGDCCGFVGPICVNALIKYVADPTTVWFSCAYYGYLLSSSIFLASIVQTLCLHQHHHLVIREAIRVRSALTMLVYEKSLTLSSQAKSSLGSGKLLNTAMMDSNRILELFYMIHYTWAAPIQLILGMLLLFHYLGVASVTGIIIMILLLPTSAGLSSQAAKISKKMLASTDKRLKIVTELFQHIRVIKLYAWESEFIRRVEVIRGTELAFLKQIIRWNAFGKALLQAGPVLVSFGTFATFSYMQSEQLTADKAFTAITLFSIFRLPLMALPQVFSLIFQARVSIKRIESILKLEEQPPRRLPPLSPSQTAAFEIRHATFKWSSKGPEVPETSGDVAPPAQLSNISISVPKGKLTLIVGAVASGKSTLVAALLGEIQPTYGLVYIPSNKVSYAAQTPFLINASIQDNILFGAPLNTARLHRVIKSCELEKELFSLPHGLQSEIGENGVTLSGGQKHRLSIARAIYRKEQDLYVFDDSLSALDPHVATRVFNQCFSERGLLAGRTRVWSTHSLQFAHLADWIIVMDKMRVVEMGTFQDLTEMLPNGKFATMFQSFQSTDEDLINTCSQSEVNSRTQAKSEVFSIRRQSESDLGGKKEAFNGSSDVLIKEEERYEGRMAWKVYVSYFVSCGVISTIGVFALLVATQIASVATDLWLTNWMSNPFRGADLTVYLTIYAYLGLSTIVLGLVGDLCGRNAGLSASKTIHQSLLHHVTKGTMRFFDTTPVGRILNRFSNDMNTIDHKLAPAILQFISMLLVLLSMLTVQTSMAPMLLLLLIPVGICYLTYKQYYEKSCRELQRLDNISKSPIYAHFTETLNGLVTIRTFHMVEHSQRMQALKIDENTKAFLLLNLINRWLGVRLEFLGAIITLAVALFVNHARLELSSAFVGLLLSYSQNMTSLLNWIIRYNIDMDNMMNSVERVATYCQIEDTESVTLYAQQYDYFTSPKSPVLELRPYWPEHGNITFVNVSVKYNIQAAPVLCGMSFTVNGGEKVGICGRTGAGKSSLFLALFRMVSLDSGSIYIDEVSTTAVTLTELRSRIAIIPQDPVLFAASVRFNLDPRGQATDKELWNAIRKARLEMVIKGLPGGLDAKVLEGGVNFSLGERQLVCLARAMLRNVKILCLDEATASMDHTTGEHNIIAIVIVNIVIVIAVLLEKCLNFFFFCSLLYADKFIQESIRTEFAEATVLTIAHRIDTILDFDKILVLKEGHIVEFGPPAKLRSTEFTTMLRKSIKTHDT